MKAILYVDLSINDQYPYEKEVVQMVKNIVPSIIAYDLDANSSPFMFDYALKLLEEAERIGIVFKVEPESQYGKVLVIANKVLKIRDKVLVIQEGKSTMIPKLFTPLKEKYIEENSSQIQKELLINFYNKKD